MQHFEVFWKLLENLQENDCDGNHFWQSLSYSKWTQIKAYFYQFSKLLFMFASKHWKKRFPLNDNIVWCKYSRVIKDFSKSGSFFLLNAPKDLGPDGQVFINSIHNPGNPSRLKRTFLSFLDWSQESFKFFVIFPATSTCQSHKVNYGLSKS